MAKIEEERVGQYLKTALKIIEENGGQVTDRSTFCRMSGS